MASSKEYLGFILDQLSGLDGITYRAMMGEYIIYYHGRIVGGIYDDRFLVKPVKAALDLMPDAPRELPYEGAKEMLLVDNVDDREFLKELVQAIYGKESTKGVQAMENYRFMELVEKENGFEFYQAFRDEIDWIIGGKDDTCWFTVMKDQSVKETYVGTLKDGVWTDRLIKGKGKKRTEKEMPAGSTIKRIEKRAYFMQDEPWVKDRKPRLIEDSHPHYHYVYGMGDKALDVSEAYGVSIAYSDIKDLSAGYHLRYLYTGEEVEKP